MHMNLMDLWWESKEAMERLLDTYHPTNQHREEKYTDLPLAAICAYLIDLWSKSDVT